ncbi:MAG TPA: hypothetical protein VJ770_19215 [Stellaceae bacterium]|nr:hypothetical protein [Stellaceae bacterium]
MAVPSSPSIGSRVQYFAPTNDPIAPNVTVPGLVTALAGTGGARLSLVLFYPSGATVSLRDVISQTQWEASGSPVGTGYYELMDANA